MCDCLDQVPAARVVPGNCFQRTCCWIETFLLSIILLHDMSAPQQNLTDQASKAAADAQKIGANAVDEASKQGQVSTLTHLL